MAGLGFLNALSLAGTAISAVGTIAAGADRKRAADLEAAQYDLKSKEERAAAQREALDAQKQKRLALASLQTRAAASGFSATDPSVIDLAGEIDEYGDYQSQIIQYGGESRAQAYTAQASATRESGAAAQRGALFDAFGGLAKGGADAFSRFGQPAYQGHYG